MGIVLTHKNYILSGENMNKSDTYGSVKANMEGVTISGGVILPPPKPKSVLWIGDKHYRTSLPADQHFNWFQKLMWKLCFGVKVEDYNEK